MQDELIKRVQALDKALQDLGRILEINNKTEMISSLQLQMARDEFWNNQKEAGIVVGKLKIFKNDVDSWNSLKSKVDDARDLIELSDASLEAEIVAEVNSLEKKLDNFRLKVLLNGEFDSADAIIEINSGAGGTEACDWAGMLFRMYFRWAQRKGFEVKVINEVRGEEAGIKSITFLLLGRMAYGYLKSERGVHRLVRISPFDSNKRRHTSFASVAVYPRIKDDISVEIKHDDLRIDTFRASGAGGQHVNKTDSAVRITHIPTGLVVSCQNERSQYQNKHMALSVLKAKLYELSRIERKENMNKISGQKRKIEWGSQIRSYVLCPYLLVKDHRTNIEKHDALAVLDGDLDTFITGYLKSAAYKEAHSF